MRKNPPQRNRFERALLQANLGMFGGKPTENNRVDQLKLIAKQLKNAKKQPE